jgi:hypothetical protein
MKQVIFLFLLGILVFSCEKDEPQGPVFPFDLEFKEIDYNQGIRTYTHQGEISSEEINKENVLADLHEYQFADIIRMRSDERASFIYQTGSADCDSSCLAVINAAFDSLNVIQRNDTLIFIAGESSPHLEFPSVGNYKEQLFFPEYIYYLAKYTEEGSLTGTIYERRRGNEDLTPIINSLTPHDTLSILKYRAVYERNE